MISPPNDYTKCCASMPTNVKESLVFEVGCLVKAASPIHCVTDEDGINFHGGRSLQTVVDEGTVGLITQRPSDERPRQFQVEFLGGIVWWVYGHEIAPR